MIEKWTPDLLTLPTTFYEVSVSSNCFPKTEMRQFGASGTDGLNKHVIFLDEIFVLMAFVEIGLTL